ncbi:MAG: CBS domain-containing protein [Spirochaetota bacterium]|nr:CBS domain-containing protein [Spirochaetota bacterium]
MARREINLSTLPVSELMTKEVITVDMDDDILKVAQIMWNNHIHSVVVVEQGELFGMFTALDLSNVLIQVESGRGGLLVKDFMSNQWAMAIHPEASLKAAIDLMNQGKFSHLPVIDSKQIVGIIAITDIITYIANGK